MMEILTSQGTTTSTYGTKTRATFYSVVHNDKLIIRTSDRRLAYKMYNELPGPAVNTQDVDPNSRKKD